MIHTVPLDEIRRALDYREIAERMREALMAYSRGECDTPMPMHLSIEPGAEVHIKSSYRRGGRYFALKIAATFPQNAQRSLPVGNGMMLLSSAETGEPVAFLADGGHLTDVRTAAVAAVTARELGRSDRAIGILGTGIQARLSAALHIELFAPDRIVLWGRSRQRAEACAREIAGAEVDIADRAADVSRQCRLIVTCTASRQPLLSFTDIQPGTHISAIGSDAPGKQELDPAILRRAALVLADSRRQCERLGDLQHAPELLSSVIEIGEYFQTPRAVPNDAITVADFTGLGAEDLYIAEYVYEKVISQT